VVEEAGRYDDRDELVKVAIFSTIKYPICSGVVAEVKGNPVIDIVPLAPTVETFPNMILTKT
jgi:hypothetical protein